MNNNKIAITKIVNNNVRRAVFDALDLIDAKSLFSKPKMKVLLKPNLLQPKDPKYAVTTHPDVFRAVVQWVKKFNPEKIITSESSGTKKRGITDISCEISGIKAVCDEENIEWIPFERTSRKVYQVKNPLVIKEIPSSALLEDVDLIINIPKIKTHGQCLLTCSIKNMFGTLILGLKSKTHKMFPNNMEFNSILVDIYSISQPQLTIIDGFYCQEGNGPSAGDVVKMDIIVAGYDPVALDTTVCNIIDFNPHDVLHITKAEEKGLGTTDLSKINFLGENINLIKRKFKKPEQFEGFLPLPKKFNNILEKLFIFSVVRFEKSKCKLCSVCWKNCPIKAIIPPKSLIQGRSTPKWKRSKCIMCYCCAELCPHEAVDFKKSFIWSIFMKFRLSRLEMVFKFLYKLKKVFKIP
jgi:uncharacterized protein (DUF362 family)